MVSLEVVAILLSGISISASLFYYANVLQNANTTRQAQLLMGIYDKFSSQAPKHERNILKMDMNKYSDRQQMLDDQEKYESFAFFNTFYEGVGVFIREGYLEIGPVAKLMSGNIISYWEKFRDFFIDWRENTGNPRVMIELEYLYNQVIEYGKTHPELNIKLPEQHIKDKELDT